MKILRHSSMIIIFMYLNHINGVESSGSEINPNTEISPQLSGNEENEFHRITMDHLENLLKLMQDIKNLESKKYSEQVTTYFEKANSICIEHLDNLFQIIETFDENKDYSGSEDEKKSYDVLRILKKMLKDYKSVETINSEMPNFDLYKSVVIEIMSRFVSIELYIPIFIPLPDNHYDDVLLNIIELFKDTCDKQRALFLETVSRDIEKSDKLKLYMMLEEYADKSKVATKALVKYYRDNQEFIYSYPVSKNLFFYNYYFYL